MKKRLLVFCTAVLIFVIILILKESESSEFPFYVQVSSGNENEIVYPWKNETGTYCIFLPGYADLSNTYIQPNTNAWMRIAGQTIVDNMRCDIFQVDKQYEFFITEWGQEQNYTLIFYQSSNVATAYIDTESGSMDYIHAEKGNEEAGNIRVYTSLGEISYMGNLEFIKGRGNYTWTEYEKKPYSFKLSESADLLGMGSAEKWILLANAGDPTNLRNKIVYDFADALGMSYSPETEWVDLYLNGKYMGVYLLSERNEVHSQRVNIAENGSFLVSMELENRLKEQGYSYVLTEAQQAFRVHYPTNASQEELEKLKVCLQTVENSILSDDGGDIETEKSWKELIDLDSWAKKYLIEEIFGNGDAGAISQFFYLDGDDSAKKVYAGPVWDYDRTMGNPVAWQLASTQAFFANRLCVEDGLNTPWFYYLYQKSEFYEYMVDVYQNQCIPLLEELLGNFKQNYAQKVSEAAKMNDVRWGLTGWNSEMETNDMIEYLKQRICFLNQIWIEGRSYYQVQADQSFGTHYAHYVVYPGETLEELPEFENTEYLEFIGWYYADTDEPFDITRPITEDIEIYAKWVDRPYKRISQIIKLMPLGIIAVMGMMLIWVDIKRMKKSR